MEEQDVFSVNNASSRISKDSISHNLGFTSSVMKGTWAEILHMLFWEEIWIDDIKLKFYRVLWNKNASGFLKYSISFMIMVVIIINYISTPPFQSGQLTVIIKHKWNK